MPSREVLVRELWPDKILYGATMLLVTGAFGFLFGIAAASGALAVTRDPALAAFPFWLSAALSLGAAVLAYWSLKERETRAALVGCALGVASFAMLGAGTVLSLVALAFVLKARKEGEDTNPATRALTPDMWPDKSLAASLLCLMTGIVTLAWAAGILLGRVSFDFGRPFFGVFALAAGAVNLYAARELFHQRNAGLGIAAGAGGVLALGMFLVGPLLSVAQLLLILQALQEREFEAPGAAAG